MNFHWVGRIGTAVLLLFFALAGIARAVPIVWDNGVTSINSYAVSQPSAGQVVFDDFNVATNTRITGVRFRGGYNQNVQRQDNLTVRLHSDVSRKPDLTSFSEVFAGLPQQVSVAGVSSVGDIIYDYLIGIDTIVSGPTWLTIFSTNSDLADGSGRWVWVHQNDFATGNEHILNTVNGTLFPFSTKVDFSISGYTIPEPSALSLVLTGSFLLTTFNRRVIAS